MTGRDVEVALRRWWPWRALAAIGSVALAFGTYRIAVDGWLTLELARSDRDVAAGRYDLARERLTRLSAFRPGMAEVHYRLGLCEQAAGRPERALAAWARIAPDSPLAAKAARDRDRLLREYHDGGKFAALEEILESARHGTGKDAAEMGQVLARLLRFEGRFDELRRLLEDEWPRSTDPGRALRDLWMLDADPVPIEMVRGVLDAAATRSPDDDRVWLGRANLAIWSGRLEEAERLLKECRARRPNDKAVWRAWLDWGRAAGRVDVVLEALEHLPTDFLGTAEVLGLHAWLAGQRGDREGERLALERLVEEDPGDARALERLATLAFQSGRPDRASELRTFKAQVDQAREQYRTLLTVEATTIDLPTVARLAESLGRWFEAKGWWSMVARFAPDHAGARAALARLTRRDASRAPGQSPDALKTTSGRLSDATRALTIILPKFSDDAEPAGLQFTYDNGRSAARQLPETMGGGVGLLDYNGDGWLDVYCVQGGPFPPPATAGRTHRSCSDRLFRNRGDGTFEDATGRAGIPTLPGGYGHGVAVGDFDNDGHPDLFVTRWRSYALARNRGDGTFEDVTERAGLGGDRNWPTSAAWADLDGDGDLDLYVCHYLAWNAEAPKNCRPPSGNGDLVYCDPRAFNPKADYLFRNDGGQFVDVTAEAGIVDPDGRGLGVVAADLDGDGRMDLFVANDTTANYLFRNLGGLRFEEVGLASGVAASGSGGFQAGMGTACGDLDGDSLPDLVVTNFYGESTTLFRNMGRGTFSDHGNAVGLTAASRALLGFGITWLDANNDGRLDLATANGHVNDYRPNVPYAMPAQLLVSDASGRLNDVSATAGPSWQTPHVGRGLAAGDLDNDGRVDLVLVAQGSPLAYLHNRTTGGHALTIRLQGNASNRDGVGARVTVTSGGRRQVAQRSGGGSYLSASDPRLHFGLAGANRVEEVEVAWPSGRVDRHRDLPAGTGYLIREGQAAPSPLQGFANPRRER